jgi:hypothetical protein
VSLSPLRVQIVVNTGLFDDALRRAIAQVEALAPQVRRWLLYQQRRRSREVTRRKRRYR